MRVLLTGGTGFVGRALVKTLAARGARLGLLVRGGPVTPGAQVFALGFKTWSEEALVEVVDAFTPDAIVHLAGGPGASSLQDLYEVNVFLGERLMSAAARAAPAARVVLIGSAAEYGAPTRPDGVLSEGDLCSPNTAYGVAKLAQTLHGLARARAGQRITIARLFNPVGPGMPAGLAFADFARRLALSPGTLATGDIDVARDFLSIEEAARIITHLMMNPGAVGQVVNVCSGVAEPLRKGVERMLTRLGRPVRLLGDPGLIRPANAPVIRGDSRKLESLGIRPASAEIGSALDALLDEIKAGVGKSRAAALS